MTGPTPGPWFDDGYRIYAPTASDDKRNGRVIMEYKHADEFNPGDAPLIAAAPELLAALRDLVRAAESADIDDTAIVLATVAIAKAEGRA